ncbi:response regulator transcription factor [Microbacterium sp.]|uniref:response regulator transcription factor n=1 Tax=Microbacterium sp. TaxID=51671 RepID=UPI002D77075A|nr:response regulator transcription factor [Microbacterium sp.]HET6302994.1 response regulator transcription factor [Microbacterium sp.]
MRVLIAEDQALLRTALATLLELEGDIEIVAQVERGDDIVPTAERTQPDMALLDIELPGRSGLDVIPDLRRAVPNAHVVVLTTFARPGYLQRALQLGARGFLLKDAPATHLAAQLRSVAAGSIVVDPDFATTALRAEPNPLTEREREVLRACEGGASIASIAALLHLSRSTVRNHLSAAIGKTGTANRIEAAVLARERGWL